VARLLLIFAVGLFTLGCGRIQAYEQQLRAAEEARAARPKRAPQRSQFARTLHIRAYADADYRAEHPNWRADVEELVETANLWVGPQLEIGFALDGSREWDRSCDTRDAHACLSELARLDEGAPDVWVVALTGGLPQLSRELDVLSQGTPLGRHVLLHGMSRLDEQDAFDMTARPLSAAERRVLARERSRHKSVLTLLHAWGHTLGVLHGGDGSTIMHASYTPEQAAFTPETTSLLAHMLEGRLRGDGESAQRVTYRRWLEAHPTAFTGEERARRLAELEDVPANDLVANQHGLELAASKDQATVDLTAEDRALLARARERAMEGKKDVALASAAELAQRYPDVAELQLFACDLGHQSSCNRAREVTGAAQ
jgi:hypothetical protein